MPGWPALNCITNVLFSSNKFSQLKQVCSLTPAVLKWHQYFKGAVVSQWRSSQFRTSLILYWAGLQRSCSGCSKSFHAIHSLIPSNPPVLMFLHCANHIWVKQKKCFALRKYGTRSNVFEQAAPTHYKGLSRVWCLSWGLICGLCGGCQDAGSRPDRSTSSGVSSFFTWCGGILYFEPAPCVASWSWRSPVSLGIVDTAPELPCLPSACSFSAPASNAVHSKGPAGADDRLASFGLGRVKDI